MSEDTPQEPIVLYTQEGIDARRNNLYDFTTVINEYENVVDEYHFSEQRIEDLKQARQKYIKKRTSLEGKNKILLKKINNLPNDLSEFNNYTDDIDSILNTQPFLVPNVKIETIIGTFGKDTVDTITLKFSDGGKKKYGGIGNPTSKSVNYLLQPTEFVIKIDRVKSHTGIVIGEAIIFYTSFGRKLIVKGENYKIDQAKTSEEKIFRINPNYKSWKWHDAEAKRSGYTLASIADSGENDKVSSLLRKYGYGSAWAGGRRKNNNLAGRTVRGRSKGDDTWAWSDRSPWRYKSAWGGGEPNDCCGGEDYLQINSNGRWNDLFPYNLPGVYSKKIKRYKLDSVTSGGIDRQITTIKSLYGDDEIAVGTDEKNITDTKALDNLENLKGKIDSLIINSLNSTNDSKIEYSDNLTIIQDINELVDVIDEQIKDINKANNFGKTSKNKSGFTNMGEKVNHFLNNIFSNNKSMKEGFKEGATNADENLNSPFYDYLMRIFSDTRYSVNDELAHTDNLEYEENRNYMLELLAQKKQVASNILMDYMINDTEGSNAEQLYEIMNQENLDKKRKIKINDYYSKTYLEYSHILKTIILLIAIMIPFLILTKYDLLDKNISLTVVIIISFLGLLYILHRLYLLYMKDNINFDKDTIPYDRQAAELIKKGRIKQKTGLQGLGITCIGEECCTDNMIYDATKHKCYPIDPTIPSTSDKADSFTNFFETMNNMNNNKKSNVVQNNMHEDPKGYTYIKEPFLTSYLDTRRIKSDMIIDSLNNSTENNMYFNKQ